MSSKGGKTYKIPDNLNILDLLRNLGWGPKKLFWLYCRGNAGGSDSKKWGFYERSAQSLVKHLHKYHYFINCLIEANQDEKYMGDKSLYTSLNQDLLKDSIPDSTYDLVVSVLYALNVIECDEIYVTHYGFVRGLDKTVDRNVPKSKGFRLTPQYRTANLTKVDANSDKHIKMAERKRKVRATKIKQMVAGSLTLTFLVNQFTSYNYTVDPDYKRKAEALLNLKYKKDTKIVAEHTVKNIIRYLDIMANYRLESFSVGQYQRVYSPMERLCSVARFLVKDATGGDLVQFDFSSSYTLHLCLEVSNRKGIYIYSSNQSPHLSPMFVPFCDLDSEINFIYNQCKGGNLYSFIAEEYQRSSGRHLGATLEASAQAVKKCWNQQFLNYKSGYTDSKTKEIDPLLEFIKRLFKQTDNFIEEVTRHRLCKILMESESGLLLNIVDRVRTELGDDCLLFTLHDGLITDQQHADLVGYIMEDEALSYLGFMPYIKSDRVLPPKGYKVDQETYGLELATVEK